MKTITYNPETHVLVPREPTRAMCDAALAFDDNKPLNDWGKIVPNTYEETYSAMIAAAPQPEPVDVGSVGWKHDCAALCANDIELWIDRCPHCGKPRHNHPPTDDELLNKAEQVESEPAMWVMKHIRSGDLAQAKPNQKALHPYMLSDAFPRYTTPQPDRVAELEAETTKLKLDLLTSYGEAEELSGKVAQLEAALKVARDGIDKFLVAKNQTEFDCACDLSVGYLCGPCHADKQQEPLKIALAKINEVLK